MGQLENVSESEIGAARRASEEDIDDDVERESRTQHAAHVIGAWMHEYAGRLAPQIAEIDKALNSLGLTSYPVITATPTVDSRFERLKELIDQRLRNAGRWGDDERLIIFTEYKTTLDYLVHRLTAEYDADDGAIITLFGGMDERQRDALKAAFNEPAAPARILIATDAASEGLNLQQTARLLLHYEIPWNPSRLEQRNGRLDRHGQARDVTIFHFTSDDDADLRFVARVLEKVDEIREDLGSVGELFDAAFQRRMLELSDDETVLSQLDQQIAGRQHATDDAMVHTVEHGEREQAQFQELLVDLDLSPDAAERYAPYRHRCGKSA